MNRAPFSALLAAALVSPVALAEPRPEAATPLRGLRSLEASTEAPQFGVEWREAARARFGAALPLLGRRETTPLALELPALLEVHNARSPDAVIPNESWRGRLGLELWWRVAATARRQHELGLVVEHESDHDSARVDSLPWFLSLNDVALESTHAFALRPLVVEVRTSVRHYFLTCTRLGACDEPMDGQATVGGALSAAADLGPTARWRGVAPFAALELAVLAPRAEVHGEERAVLHLGVHREGSTAGSWQLFALGLVGNDVGLRRYRSVSQLGFGLRWAPTG